MLGYEDEPYVRVLERRDGRGQPSLADQLPERGPLRRRRGPGRGRRGRGPRMGGRRRPGPLRLARPPHPLHGPGPSAAGGRRVGRDRRSSTGPSRSRSTASRRDRRHADLGARRGRPVDGRRDRPRRRGAGQHRAGGLADPAPQRGRRSRRSRRTARPGEAAAGRPDRARRARAPGGRLRPRRARAARRPSAAPRSRRPPEQVSFRFNEPVEASFGALAVYDRDGRAGRHRRARSSPATAPTRSPSGLSPGLADGVYTATYRVISADRTRSRAASRSPSATPARRRRSGSTSSIDDAGGGPGDRRWRSASPGSLSYPATAICDRRGRLPGLRLGARARLRSRAAATAGTRRPTAFGDRLRRLVAVGARRRLARRRPPGSSLQGAIGLGGSFSATALRPAVIEDVLATRFGTVWGLRLLDFAALAVLLLAPAVGLRYRTLVAGAARRRRIGARRSAAREPDRGRRARPRRSVSSRSPRRSPATPASPTRGWLAARRQLRRTCSRSRPGPAGWRRCSSRSRRRPARSRAPRRRHCWRRRVRALLERSRWSRSRCLLATGIVQSVRPARRLSRSVEYAATGARSWSRRRCSPVLIALGALNRRRS